MVSVLVTSPAFISPSTAALVHLLALAMLTESNHSHQQAVFSTFREAATHDNRFTALHCIALHCIALQQTSTGLHLGISCWHAASSGPADEEAV